MDHNEHFLHLVNEAKTRIKEISSSDLKNKLRQSTSFYLIDVREIDEWQDGHIEKAIHCPRGILERDVGDIVKSYESEIIVYCGGGYRSALAADSLQKMGYKHVLSLNGGVRVWNQSGFELI